MSELSDVLEKIGLTSNELKVYEVIIAFGFRTKGQISSYTDLVIDEVSEACTSLVEKNFLKLVKGRSEEGDIYIPLAPKISIASNVSENLSNKLKNLSTEVSKLWSNTQQSIDNDTTKLISTVQESLNEYSTKLMDYCEIQKEELSSLNENFKTEFSELSGIALSSFQDRVNKPLKEISAAITKFSTGITKGSEGSVTALNKATDQHKLSIDEAISQIKTELEEFTEEIGLIATGRISGLNQQIENISSQSSENGEKVISKVQKTVEELFNAETERISSLNADLPDGILDNYDATSAQFKTVFTEMKAKYNELIDSTVFASDKAKNETLEASKELINRLNTSQISKVSQLESELLTAVQTIQTDAVVQLDSVLKQTSEELNSLEASITANLGQNEKDLNKDLTKLKKELSSALNTRFEEIGEKLSGFIENLKTTSQGNVDELVGSINELKDFLLNFLSETKTNLDTQLDSLQKGVATNLKTIVTDSNKDLNSSISHNKKDMSEIEEKIDGDLNNFQQSINEFLRSIKQNLQEKLEEAQSSFNSGVSEGVSNYETEAAKRKEEQELHIKDINQEAKTLSDEAKKSRENLVTYNENELNQRKDETLEKIHEHVQGSSDKYTREITRFVERMERELKNFFTNFHDQSSGLRDQIPQGIERLFVDQTDKMENFRRDFERVIGHSIDTLDKFMGGFSEDHKKIKVDKKDIPQLHGDLSRAWSDFKSFEDQIITHFRTSIEATEDTRDELIAMINKTIQDELTDLEEIVETKTSETKAISGEFISSLTQNTINFTDDVKSGLNEQFNELQSEISSQLIALLQQPLESILSNAQYIATGTEGIEEENRLLLTQQVLIEKIQEAVGTLVGSLKDSFDNSIQDLDTQVETSIGTSNEIIIALQKDLEKSFLIQKDSRDSFTKELKSSLKKVQTTINETLGESLSNGKTSVEETVSTKSQDVEDSVNSKTDIITQTTIKTLTDMDSAFSGFTDEFNLITKETSNQVASTVTKTTKSQKKHTKGAIQTLKSASSQAQSILEGTQNSLNENVSQALSEVETDVKTLVEGFDAALAEAENNLLADIEEAYAGGQKYLTELSSYKKSISKATSDYLKNVNTIGDEIKSGIKLKITHFEDERKESNNIFQTDLTKSFGELSDQNANFIIETFDQVSTQLSSLQAEVLGALENVKSNVDLTVTNAVETVRTDILNAANVVEEVLETEKGKITTNILEIAKSFDEFDKSQDNLLHDSSDKYKDEIHSKLDGEATKWKSKIEDVNEIQSKILQDLAKEFEGVITSTSSSGKKSVTDSLDEIPTTIEKTLDEAAKSMVLLNEISKGSIELDPKIPELSYFDSSSEAILSNLNAVLSRAKSSITIVAPTISWLDEELIPKFARVTVRIISDLDQHTAEDTKLIDKFKVEGVNMSLRKLDRNRYRGDIDMIMATRDKEEVILAKLPNSPDPYAFISQDELFIDKLGELFIPFHTMPEV
ncbi:MAG: apolipoprotein A-IV repeat region-like domain-containing protein [Candidatus Kariarchaeaceae archaeon]|jgi:hypothetical protein